MWQKEEKKRMITNQEKEREEEKKQRKVEKTSGFKRHNGKKIRKVRCFLKQ